MFDVIDNATANSGLPNGTVLLGIDGGDTGCYAIRVNDRWSFTPRQEECRANFIAGTAPMIIDRLFSSAYRVLYRPGGEGEAAEEVGTGRFRIGQEFDRHELAELPVGAVVKIDYGTYDWNLMWKADDGTWAWGFRDGGVNIQRDVFVDGWELIYLPSDFDNEVPAEPVKVEVPKVGARVVNPEEFAALPVGSVALDLDEPNAVQVPAVKVDDDEWVYFNTEGVEEREDDEGLAGCGAHRVIHVPGHDHAKSDDQGEKNDEPIVVNDGDGLGDLMVSLGLLPRVA